MGLHRHFSCSSYDKKPVAPVVHVHNTVVCPPQPKQLPNPDPENFKILSSQTIGNWLIIKVNYPDCTNYEGNKILLYKYVTVEQLIAQGSIDPHFSNNCNFHSPVARFIPTDDGWRMACKIAQEM